MVTMPARSVPEGVTKLILIDGQQRLTTVLVLLAAIRDKARHLPGTLADKVDDLYLKNRHQEGTDILKVLPTQVAQFPEASVLSHPLDHRSAVFVKRRPAVGPVVLVRPRSQGP
jgi:hypothetical protein